MALLRYLHIMLATTTLLAEVPTTRLICGNTLLPNGEVAKDCLEASWNPAEARLEVSPLTVASGSAVTVSWSSSGAHSCQLTFGENSRTGVSSEPFQVVITAETVFRLSCDGPGGAGIDTKTVRLLGAPAGECDPDDEDRTDTISSSRFPSILGSLGFPANGLLIWDGFHAQMVCEEAGYKTAVSLQRVAARGSCDGKVIAARRLSQPGGWQTTPACDAGFFMGSVNCRFKRKPECPKKCPETRGNDIDYFSRDFVASRHNEVAMYPLKSSRCLGIDGASIGSRAAGCGYIRSDPASRQQVCTLLGYSTVESYSNDSHSSCGNNVLVFFNPDSGRFVTAPACSFNSYVKHIRCAGPIEPQCATWY